MSLIDGKVNDTTSDTALGTGATPKHIPAIVMIRIPTKMAPAKRKAIKAPMIKIPIIAST